MSSIWRRLRYGRIAVALAITIGVVWLCGYGCSLLLGETAEDPNYESQNDNAPVEIRPARRTDRYLQNVLAKPAVKGYNYARMFNDMQDKQIVWARRLGVKRLLTREDAARQRLQEVTCCNLYHVNRLDYSIPYLVPKAKRLLDDIGRGFRDSLRRAGIKGIVPVVTSVTRCEADVKRLRRSGNTNASRNSCHCYGTTFDISNIRFRYLPDDETVNSQYLKEVLAGVIYNLKRQNRCLVKNERNQHCFHITVRE